MSKLSAKNGTRILSYSSCSTAAAIREQTCFYSPGVIVSDSDVSYEFLIGLLAKLKVQAIVDENGELQVPEAFGPNIGLRLIPSRHWIFIHTGFETPNLDDDDRTEFSNYLSNSLAMAQFAATDGGIGMGFYMYYRGGLNVDQLMAMIQRFGSLACAAMRKCVIFPMDAHQQGDDDSTSVTMN